MHKEREIGKDNKSDFFNESIVYILEKFPSPTEYFVLNEILELQREGIRLHVFVLRKQKKYIYISDLKNVKSQVIYLPQVYFFFPVLSFIKSPIYFIKNLNIILYCFNHAKAHTLSFFLRSLRNYCICLFFTQLVKGINIKHIHAHFAFIACDIAQILSKVLKVKYSVSVHAQDIYTSSHKIKQLTQNASFMITCTKYNFHYLNELTDYKFKDRIYHTYHGINVSKWPYDRSKSIFKDSVIRLLSVARLVEKKGIVYLLKAIRLLIDKGYKVECNIIGDGLFRKELRNFINDNKIYNIVNIHSFLPQEKIINFFKVSDIFILPCVVANNGDRDGLPNVLLEAMAMGIPVISTNISAIPEIVEDRVTGMLVMKKDGTAIANAIIELKNNKDLYNTIIKNARRKIIEEFSIEECTNKLIEIFKSKI